MRNRTITYGLLGLILVLFMLYFLVQSLCFSSGRTIADLLEHLAECAEEGRWTEAENTAEQLLQSWNRSKYLLAVNYAEADYSIFMDNLDRIRGAVRRKDDTEAVSLVYASINLWNNFLRVVPEP